MREAPILLEVDKVELSRFHKGRSLPPLPPASIEIAKKYQLVGTIVCRPLPQAHDRFEVIRHLNAWRVAQTIGMHVVPAVVRDIDDDDAMRMVLADIKAESSPSVPFGTLDPITEAELLAEELKGDATYVMYGQRARAARGRGVTRALISQRLALLKLPAAVQRYGRQKRLSFAHLRALAGLPADKQIELAKRAVSETLSKQSVEQLARDLRQQGNAKRPADVQKIAGPKKVGQDADRRRLAQKLSEYFQATVRVFDDKFIVQVGGDFLIASGVLDAMKDAQARTGYSVAYDGKDVTVAFKDDDARENFLAAIKLSLD